MNKRVLFALWLLMFVSATLHPAQAFAAVFDSTYGLATGYSEWDGTFANRFLPETIGPPGQPDTYKFDYGSEGVVVFKLPWMFTFYGTGYTQFTAYANGTIAFDGLKVISVFSDDLNSYYWGGVFVQNMNDRVVIEWKTESLIDAGSGKVNKVAVVLFEDGRIRYDYNHLDPTAQIDLSGTGISPNDGTNGITLPIPSPQSGLYSLYLLALIGDSDNDGLSNADEMALGCDPFNSDTDADGIPDGQDLSPLVAGYFPAPTETLLTATFYGESLVDSNIPGQTQAAVVGDELGVFDPDGVLCGRAQITVDGEIGTLTVYGDDPATTGVDEGAIDNDTLTVRYWDSQRKRELPVRTLQLNGGRTTLTWSDNGGDSVTIHGLAQQKIGVFRPSNVHWYADADGNGAWDAGIDSIASFGQLGDLPAVGDWNGEGLQDLGVFRDVDGLGYFYFDSNGSGALESGVDQALQFGLGSDTPVVGDWNGDGFTQIGVFRNGTWYLDINGNGTWDAGIDSIASFGQLGDLPAVGDWNGDGLTQIGVFRNGTWYLDINGNGAWDAGIDSIASFGQLGDLPAVGDWNGDGKSQVGVFRNGTWLLDINGNVAWDADVDLAFPSFGLPDDRPTGGVWR
jgi:hypothetical protein